MARAIASVRTNTPLMQDYVRISVTSFCALALIAAGPALPFIG
ncbi:hypothetical protein [Aurantiacibacter aquimixticola]|nr:hypothetical protein [Aurantiacibacter aquimixticola]